MVRRDGVDGVAAGVVLVVGHQQLVSPLKPETAKNGVDAGGRVGNEHEVVGTSSQEPRQNPARLIELPEIVVIEEDQRLAFDLESDARLLVEHRLRSRAE